MTTYLHRRSWAPMSLTRQSDCIVWREMEWKTDALYSCGPWGHQTPRPERSFNNKVSERWRCTLCKETWTLSRRGCCRRATMVGDFNFLCLNEVCKAFKLSFWWVRLINDLRSKTQQILIFQARACRRPGCSRSPTSYICKFSSHLI